MAPADPRERAWRRALALLLALSLALRWLYLPDPWSGLPSDFHNHFGAFAAGGPVTHFLDRGLADTGGMPCDWGVTLADGSSQRAWYSHHPAGFMLLTAASMALFGREEWAMRLPALLFSLLSVWSVARLGRAWRGPRTGLLAGLAMAVVPFSVHFGVQVWTEGALVALGALYLHEYLAWTRGAAGRGPWMCLWVAAGGLLDWPMHFFWAPSALHALATRGRAALALFPVPAVALATIALHWLHVQLTVPAADHAVDRAATLSAVFTSPVPWSEFFANQGRFWARYAGWPSVLLALVGMASRAGRREGFVGWLGLLPGALYVGLFPGRSFDHSFFGMRARPGLALAAASGYTALEAALARRLSPGAARSVGALLLLCLGLAAAWQNLWLWSTRRSPQIRDLVSSPWLTPWLEDREAVLLTHMGRGMCLPFYSRAEVVHSVNTPADLERLRESLVARLPTGVRAAFFIDGQYLVQLPEGPALLAALSQLAPPERHSSLWGEFALIPLN
jgi:hypothetical protein